MTLCALEVPSRPQICCFLVVESLDLLVRVRLFTEVALLLSLLREILLQVTQLVQVSNAMVEVGGALVHAKALLRVAEALLASAYLQLVDTL